MVEAGHLFIEQFLSSFENLNKNLFLPATRFKMPHNCKLWSKQSNDWTSLCLLRSSVQLLFLFWRRKCTNKKTGELNFTKWAYSTLHDCVWSLVQNFSSKQHGELFLGLLAKFVLKTACVPRFLMTVPLFLLQGLTIRPQQSSWMAGESSWNSGECVWPGFPSMAELSSNLRWERA